MFSLVMIVLLVASALISGSEVAFFSIVPSQVEELKSSQKTEDRIILNLLMLPEKESASRKLLATILIVNNFIKKYQRIIFVWTERVLIFRYVVEVA